MSLKCNKKSYGKRRNNNNIYFLQVLLLTAFNIDFICLCMIQFLFWVSPKSIRKNNNQKLYEGPKRIKQNHSKERKKKHTKIVDWASSTFIRFRSTPAAIRSSHTKEQKWTKKKLNWVSMERKNKNSKRTKKHFFIFYFQHFTLWNSKQCNSCFILYLSLARNMQVDLSALSYLLLFSICFSFHFVLSI